MKKGKVIWALLFIGIAVLILAGGLGVIPEVSRKLIVAVLLGAVVLGTVLLTGNHRNSVCATASY